MTKTKMLTGLAVSYTYVSKVLATISFNHAGHNQWSPFKVRSEQKNPISDKPRNDGTISQWAGETMCTLDIDGCSEGLRITKEQIFALLEKSGVPKSQWFETIDDDSEPQPVKSPKAGETYSFSRYLRIRGVPPSDPRGNTIWEFQVEAN